MSHINNRLNPLRRQKILAKREVYRRVAARKAELRALGHDEPVPIKNAPVGPSDSYMAMRTRRASMRYLKMRLDAGRINEDEAKALAQSIYNGVATRQDVYGFHPTKAV
tara:strand:- start:147 stop:473 length:327 start_codon:yes stop_codon:yes gene_type:complete